MTAKTAKTANNKHSAKKKLIPAVGMLLASAMALSSSTYAWFTMSREVEVTGIQMAATVPEDLQISLGALTSGELNASTGIITGGSATTPVLATDWSNAAIVSNYYSFGKLIPASSTTGQNVYFTPDADGVGKTVSGEANYYQASAGATAYEYKAADETFVSGGGGDSAMATLHAYNATEKTGTNTTGTWAVTEEEGDDGGYFEAASWNDTNDDGYYVDIPVWIRSSSDAAVNLKVDGYVVPLTQTAAGKKVSEADLELYKAARIAILHGDTIATATATGGVVCTTGNAVQTKNVIPLNDGVQEVTYDATTHAITGVTEKANKFAADSILDSGNITALTQRTFAAAYTTYGATDLLAVESLGSGTKADGTGSYVSGVYNKYTAYDSATATTNVVATIEAAPDGQEYGTAKKLILRVWLDGEDAQCWNQNAGQDFAITLKFSKIESNS